MKAPRIFIALLIAASVGLAAPLVLSAQFTGPEPVITYNTTLLHPVDGAKVTIIFFEDLQCPYCADANPVVLHAAEKFGVPVRRVDFPLPKHAWAFPAAVDARWFDARTPSLGLAFRIAIMDSQKLIHTPDDVQAFAAKFALDHEIVFPAATAVDPDGALTKLVKDDVAFGHSVGIVHTPTIWIVSTKSAGTPLIEEVNDTLVAQRIAAALKESAQ
jgi:protein-disulfide isomerase